MKDVIYILITVAVWYFAKHSYYTQGYEDGLADASKTIDDLLK